MFNWFRSRFVTRKAYASVWSEKEAAIAARSKAEQERDNARAGMADCSQDRHELSRKLGKVERERDALSARLKEVEQDRFELLRALVEMRDHTHQVFEFYGPLMKLCGANGQTQEHVHEKS